jgi:hypothetical protein
MAVSVPALLPPEFFPLGTPYTVVNNIVFQKLGKVQLLCLYCPTYM